MRALALHAYDGTRASLTLVEKPLPEPGKGEVLVKITAAAMNPSDLLLLRGEYGTLKTLPFIAGIEGSGTVVAAGAGWRALVLIGQRVAVACPDDRDGTWAEYAAVPASYCMPLLKHISTVQGASMLINPFTAWALVDQARHGHRAAVQTAAASSLGQMVMRLAQRFSFPMVHIVRRAQQAALLHAMGAHYVLDSSDPEFDHQLHEVCHQLGATFAMDAVAGDMTRRLLHAMPDGSTVAVYGLLSGEPCRVEVDDLVFHRKRVEGFWLTDWVQQRNQASLLQGGLQIQRLLTGELKTPVRACVPLDDAAFALDLYEQHMSEGKVLFLPGLRRQRER
jgi:NADPH:quinone reductase-like Zn-dependent oxidoreductase